MDYQRGALVVVLLGLIALTACAPNKLAQDGIALPEITKWVQADANLVQVLTSEPAECLVLPQDNDRKNQIALGRTAFRSPYLLGGQAARRGFSCNACHTNGAVNDHFFIEGMSTVPGTADVTSFHFSKTLGDDIFNPKPIPFLFSRPTPKTEREAIVLRLIEQEFGGATPSAPINAALITYVEALNNSTCEHRPALSGSALLGHRISMVDQIFGLLADEPSVEVKNFITAALRTELGRLYERYPENPKLQRILKRLSSNLANENIDKAALGWEMLKPTMVKQYEKSLFNPEYTEGYIQ